MFFSRKVLQLFGAPGHVVFFVFSFFFFFCCCATKTRTRVIAHEGGGARGGKARKSKTEWIASFHEFILFVASTTASKGSRGFCGDLEGKWMARSRHAGAALWQPHSLVLLLCCS